MLLTDDNVITMLPTDQTDTLFDREVIKVNKESDNLVVEVQKPSQCCP